MKFYVNWRTATKAILKNRKRSLLTMLGIIIGIAAVITIISLGRSYERFLVKSLSSGESEEVKIDVYFLPSGMNGNTTNYFNDADLSMIEKVNGVKTADYPKPDYSNISKKITTLKKEETEQIALAKKTSEKISCGRNLTSYDDDARNKVAIIDSKTAKDLYVSTNRALNRGISIDGQVFRIVGVFPSEDAANLFVASKNIEIPKAAYLYYFKNEKENNTIEITLNKKTVPTDVISNVIKKLEISGTMHKFGEYQAMDNSALSDTFSSLMNGVTAFISAIAAISLFIAGVGVMNMMYISVSERTNEIGIRRAMGATRTSIRMQFLLEGMTLTVTGGIIGLLFGTIFAYVIGKVMGFPVSVDLFTVSLAIGVSSGIGLVFSVMPAAAAAKKDLIEILR